MTDEPVLPDAPPTSSHRRWDDRTRQLLEDWHLRATTAQFGHQTRAEQTRRWSVGLGLPVVILTTLVGTSAFATIDERTSDEAKLLVGGISILAAVLAGIQTFLGYSQVAERHRIAATRYANCRRAIEVALMRHDASSVDAIRGEMDKVGGASPQIGTTVWEASLASAKAEIGAWAAAQGGDVRVVDEPAPEEVGPAAPRT